MANDKSKPSSQSPINSLEGTIKISGGMPPKLNVEQIFRENEPPKTAAKDSTSGMGSDK